MFIPIECSFTFFLISNIEWDQCLSHKLSSIDVTLVLVSSKKKCYLILQKSEIERILRFFVLLMIDSCCLFLPGYWGHIHWQEVSLHWQCKHQGSNLVRHSAKFEDEKNPCHQTRLPSLHQEVQSFWEETQEFSCSSFALFQVGRR